MATTTIQRRASLRWLDHPPLGVARVAVGSRAFTSLPLSIREHPPEVLETTPGELLAAGYCGSLSVLLAERLRGAGKPAAELLVDAELSLEDRAGVFALSALAFHVRARVADLAEEEFERAARETLTTMLRSSAVRDDLATSLDAALL
jgi:organic hydroperoxide reductase OsmC/OhrA